MDNSLRAANFHFDHYDWEPSEKQLTCHYQLDGKHFTETVFFDFDIQADLDEATLESALFGYFIMAGISYYKAGLPNEITLNPKYNLSQAQADFFSKVYFHGLGELFYQNNITPFEPQFPSTPNYQLPTTNNESTLQDTIIVPLGGGKDSLTSVQLLQDAGINFQTWTVGDYPGLIPSLKEMHGANWQQSHLKIKRHICPNLITLNKNGAINGHVPISAIWAFLSVITALLTHQKYIAFSNESSANQPTLELNGLPINHQYSKTLEFENDFRTYVHANIHSDLEYFSLLRPLTELRIAEIFSGTAWTRFHDKFSSCNRNFTQAAQGELHWCGKCPKCAFVFLILSPFIPPAELLKVFGKNLFSDSNLNETWLELLGQTEAKPFECVGMIEEVKMAFHLAKTQWPEIAQWEGYLDNSTDFNFRAISENNVPEYLITRLFPA